MKRIQVVYQEGGRPYTFETELDFQVGDLAYELGQEVTVVSLEPGDWQGPCQRITQRIGRRVNDNPTA